MYSAWPGDSEGHIKSIELRVAEMSLRDAEEPNRLAESMRWKGVELAWTSIGTVAVSELHSVKFPFGHSGSPCCSPSTP
jgi:hypothetical protein